MPFLSRHLSSTPNNSFNMNERGYSVTMRAVSDIRCNPGVLGKYFNLSLVNRTPSGSW